MIAWSCDMVCAVGLATIITCDVKWFSLSGLIVCDGCLECPSEWCCCLSNASGCSVCRWRSVKLFTVSCQPSLTGLIHACSHTHTHTYRPIYVSLQGVSLILDKLFIYLYLARTFAAVPTYARTDIWIFSPTFLFYSQTPEMCSTKATDAPPWTAHISLQSPFCVNL